MLARCARCQGTFTTDRYGLQTCPNCGSELLLADPSAPPPEAPPAPPEAAGGPTWSAAPPPPAGEAAPPPGGGHPPPPAAGAGGAYPPPPAAGGGAYAQPPPTGGGWAPLPPASSPVASPELAAPFADRAGRGFFGAFFETWKLAAVEPQKFFARVRIDQTGAAVLFALIAFAVGATAQGLYGLLWAGQMNMLMEQLGRSAGEQAEVMRRMMGHLGGGWIVAQVLFGVVLDLVVLFLGAGILHLLLVLFRGATRGFDATLTVVAFSFGLHLLLVLPVCGSLVAVVWQAVVLIIGLAAVHRCSTGKAALAVLAPLVLLCCCCCAAAGVAGMAGFGTALRSLGGSAPDATNL